MVCNFFPINVPSDLPDREFIYSMTTQPPEGSLRVRFHRPLLVAHPWALGLWSIGQGSRQVGPLPKGDRVDGRRPARILWACLWLVHLTGSNLFVTIPPNRQYIVIMTNYMKFREGDTTIRQVPPAGTNRIYYLIKSIYWPNRDRHLTDRHELCAERWQGMRGIIKNDTNRARK